MRRSVRAILFDGLGHLVLLRRERPGRAVYWVTPGGGVEPTDASPEAALRRELWEELGATIEIVAGPLALADSSARATESGESPEQYYLVGLLTLDERMRSGAELSDPDRGRYTIERFALEGVDFAVLNLQPGLLRDLLARNGLTFRAFVGAARSRIG